MKLSCGHEPSPHGKHTTGYGITAGGRKICWTCCAERDKEQMRRTGKTCLYLVTETIKVNAGDGKMVNSMLHKAKLTNWPGSLEIPCYVVKGKHNMAGSQYRVSFEFEGHKWHGTQYGENTMLCHCKRNK